MAVASGDDGAVVEQHSLKIVFFDVETTIPLRTGQKHELLEFAAVVLDAQGLFELHSYNTLIRPKELSNVTRRSVDCNGITRENVAAAPTFAQVADEIFQVLDGRIWAGHNVVNFDIPRINEAFLEINRPAPCNVGVVDTYPLLRKTFGKRAGNYKLATLANYCGYGKQEHRSLADVRMNLAVLRSCSTMLLLENNYPQIFPGGPQNHVCASASKQSTRVSVAFSESRTSRSNGMGEQTEPQSSLLESSVESLPIAARICEEGTANQHPLPTFEQGNSLSELQDPVGKSLFNAEQRQLNTLREVAKESSSTSDFFHMSISPSRETSKGIYTDAEEEDVSQHNMPADSRFTQYKPCTAQAIVESLEEWGKVSVRINEAACGAEGNVHDVLKEFSLLGVAKTLSLDGNVFQEKAGNSKDGDVYDITEELSSLSLGGPKDCPKDCQDAEAAPTSSNQDSIVDLAGGPFLSASSISLTSIELRDETNPLRCSKVLFYNGSPLQLLECRIKMRFTVNPSYAFDDEGKPRLSVLLEPSESACEVLKACDELVRREMLVATLSVSGEITWLPALTNKGGIWGARMSVGTKGYGASATYTTKFYQHTANGLEEIPLGFVDVMKFRNLLPHGSIIDVGFGLYIFNLQNRMGVRLLAKKITIL